MAKPSKHLPYYTVLEVFQKADECPLCVLEADCTRHYFETVLYENVNDCGVRKALVKSRGYCHRHAHLLLTYGDGLGTAILYQDQIELFLGYVSSASRRADARWAGHGECPACLNQAVNRKNHISTFMEGLSDKEMLDAFRNSPGLCVPHFVMVADACKSAEQLKVITEVERSKYENLLEELREFCRKQDYRFRGEPAGRESDSWKRAVRMSVGNEIVF